MQLKDIMTENPACCRPDSRLAEVARLMVENNCGAIPVIEGMDNMKPIGIITDRDIVVRALATGKNPLELRAQDVMSGHCVTMRSEDGLEDLCDTMEVNQVRRVLITENGGRLIGIVAQADLAKAAPKEQTAEVVREISQ